MERYASLKILLRCQFPGNLWLQWNLDQHPEDFFEEIDNMALRYMQKYEKPELTKTISKKKEVIGLILPDLKIYYKATVVKTVWCWYKDRHIDQNCRIESPIDPHIKCLVDFCQKCQGNTMGIG